jgi:acetyl-CoA carboxylase biotin carboxyl carrier protein
VSNNSKKTSPFDVKTVESLVALMTANDISEVYLRDGDQHLRLRRGPEHVVAAPVAMAPAAAHHAAPAAAKPAEPAPATKAKSNLFEIKSETVGTFYTQAKPGEPAFAKVGDRVTPTKVVGLVEVMKTYNEIQAGCTGVIVEALVESGKYVEFNQVLFRVEPA